MKQNDISGDVHAGVTQRSALGPLLFSIYINDLSDNLTCNAKFFAADTSLFLVVHDINTSAKELYEWSIEKWVSILIRENKPTKLFSVANQRDQSTHL